MRLSQAEIDVPIGQPLLITEVERRILRACKTLRAVPDHEAKFMKIYSPWPEIKRAVEDAYGYTEATMPKFRPSPADVSDMLTALSWARAIEKREFKLVWWRSFDISFKHIGLRIGRSDEMARLRYKDAILKIWCVANSANSQRA
jgi:hypothetical protein